MYVHHARVFKKYNKYNFNAKLCVPTNPRTYPIPALRGRMFDNADATGVFNNDRTASLVNSLTGDAAPLLPLHCAVTRGHAWSERLML